MGPQNCNSTIRSRGLKNAANAPMKDPGDTPDFEPGPVPSIPRAYEHSCKDGENRRLIFREIPFGIIMFSSQVFQQ